MSHGLHPKKRSISREEMATRQQQRDWAEHSPQWDEFSARALNGLQYHPADEPLDNTFRRLEQKFMPQAAGRFSLSLRQRLSIAAGATILIISALFVSLRHPSNEKLYAQYFEYLPSAIHEGGGARATSPKTMGLRASAVQAYETGAYEDAEALARVYLEENPADQEMRFYFGLMLLGKGDAGSAIQHLEAVRTNPKPIEYERPATWYLGLAYLKRGQTDKASLLFKELKDGDGRYAELARSVLEKL
ncbi:MAG: hypothetical protein KDC66_12100 [Phaeodactylibacter sp.]|nr:hypothetical protein [Phaeodactylibacter sp.]MCB9274231.1 hypothetical protein [Lewinellaceae bacterium]